MKDVHAIIGTGILCLMTWGGMAVGWGVQTERVETLRAGQLEQREANRKCDERIRAVENDRGVEKQLNVITGRLVALEVLVQGLREDLKGKRR